MLYCIVWCRLSNLWFSVIGVVSTGFLCVVQLYFFCRNVLLDCWKFGLKVFFAVWRIFKIYFLVVFCQCWRFYGFSLSWSEFRDAFIFLYSSCFLANFFLFHVIVMFCVACKLRLNVDDGWRMSVCIVRSCCCVVWWRYDVSTGFGVCWCEDVTLVSTFDGALVLVAGTCFLFV